MHRAADSLLAALALYRARLPLAVMSESSSSARPPFSNLSPSPLAPLGDAVRFVCYREAARSALRPRKDPPSLPRAHSAKLPAISPRLVALPSRPLSLAVASLHHARLGATQRCRFLASCLSLAPPVRVPAPASALARPLLAQFVCALRWPDDFLPSRSVSTPEAGPSALTHQVRPPLRPSLSPLTHARG